MTDRDYSIEENFIGDHEHLDRPIYRILRVEHLVADVAHGYTTLNRVIGWDDTHEAAYFRRSIALPGEEHGLNLEQLSRNWFGQCWSELAESDAMWRIYNPRGMSVRIQTTPRKLMQSAFLARVRRHPAYNRWARNTLYMGEVEYLNKADFEVAMLSPVQDHLQTSGKGLASQLLLKREPFNHETEVRFLFQSGVYLEQEADAIGEAQLLSSDLMKNYVVAGRTEELPQFIRLPLDWTCIDSVMFGPRVRNRTLQRLQRQVQRALPQVPVLFSELYGPPAYIGTL